MSSKMASVAILRSSLAVIRQLAASSAPRSAPLQNPVSPSLTNPKVPLTLFGASGNYASALYIAATKVNALDKVESELIDFVNGANESHTFCEFLKDLSLSKNKRVKAMTDICADSKFSDITRNFLVVLAEQGRLKLLQDIKKKFSELTMAHRGEVIAVVTTVNPITPDVEKEVIETLQEIIGEGKKVILELKVDPSILGGLMVEYNQKLFDMSMRSRLRQCQRFLREPLDMDIPSKGD